MALQSRAFCFPLYPVVDGCFSFAPALGADPVNSLCAGSCYLHRVDAGVELTVPVVAQFRMKFRKHKKKPQKPILCGLHLFILYFLSYPIRTDAQGKNMAKSWQNCGIDKANRACSVTKPESSRINRFAQICHLVYFLVIYCKFMLAFWCGMCYYNYRR